VVFGILSVLVYKPWRRVGKRRAMYAVERPETPWLETADEERTRDRPAVESVVQEGLIILDVQQPKARMP